MHAILNKVRFIIGDQQILRKIDMLPALEPFSEGIINFLDDVSKGILNNKESSKYPDAVTFAFWCRRASIVNLKKEYFREHGGLTNDGDNTFMNKTRFGRGCVFHIAPSNVAVNYAYSLVVGMIAGNTNIVRLPSKYFPQVNLINSSIKKAIENYQQFLPCICLVEYGHEKEITDYLSLKCDTRVIWGGDTTISKIRKSPLKARANEITFADRYSISVIDSIKYLETLGKERIAHNFYNDTYLTDQNACTSPRILIWIGNKETSKKAQEEFWGILKPYVENRFDFKSIQAVSKLKSVYKIGAGFIGARLNETDNSTQNNKITRVQVQELTEELKEFIDNSGFFIEYYANTLSEIEPICESQCQTLSYFGIDIETINHFIITSKPRGIDRVVPIGKTMDFNLFWDGYDLIGKLTRKVTYSC